MQMIAPAAEYMPTEHERHKAAPVPAWYKPEGQPTQKVAPMFDAVPEPHWMQLAAAELA